MIVKEKNLSEDTKIFIIKIIIILITLKNCLLNGETLFFMPLYLLENIFLIEQYFVIFCIIFTKILLFYSVNNVFEFLLGINKVEYDEDGLVMELDDIFKKDFKRGHQGELQEIERQRRSLTRNSKAYAFAGDHTNWDVDAVADEDDLDNDNSSSDKDEEEEGDDDDAEWRRVEELQKNKKK